MKIRILDKQFFYNGASVICKLDCYVAYSDDQYNLKHSIWPKIQKAFKSCSGHSLTYGEHYFSVVGKAKCMEGETYDRQIGEDIAEARAYKKVYKIGRQIAGIYVRKLNDWLDDFMYKYNRYDDLIDEEVVNINTLSNN